MQPKGAERLKKLIVIRHGHYHFGNGDHLSEIGKNQMARMIRLLQPILKDGSVAIMSSTANRAKESAEILANGLDTTFSEHEVLWSERRHPEDLPAALKLIRSVDGKADNLILVTHLEYGEYLPPYFAKHVLESKMGQVDINKGEGWVIDCEAKSLKVLR